MNILKHLIGHSLLALALLAHSAAQALPTYRVTVDTSAYSGQGWMDFTFLAHAGAAPATAVMGNFIGTFGATIERSTGAMGAVPGQLVLGNQGGGDYLTQLVDLGGLFSFDIRFDGAVGAIPNENASRFNATLYTVGYRDFIGPATSFATFDLLPMTGAGPGGVAIAWNSLAAVAEIPEPSTLLLLLSALPVLALLGRKRPAVAVPFKPSTWFAPRKSCIRWYTAQIPISPASRPG